ncbi:uracil-DNA glycosylase [Zavarzinia compransoris]|uniref:Uracil-DNA glycosylase n=1 Tax=Zavarzinia compransoris TaxID=1264899 RepID=A0A317EAM5_9PROT|nr:uracil-DNA glycosylase [Zavarzinia compransoris]PWR23602.1 uracil-DNA glycosylase [Zavarzinia compransoris]TDP47819.1 uracil-DNA glycosylase [Zavarzinia compransoris]
MTYPFDEACAGLGPDWLAIVEAAARRVDPAYLAALSGQEWLPGPALMLAALRLVPIEGVRAVLIGESPYPRAQSARGEAFYDGAVGPLWGPGGLAKPVNRATSLRNIMKMLLVAAGHISADARAEEIAALDPGALGLVATMDELFRRIRAEGILCLNAIPVLTAAKARDAKAWSGFMDVFLAGLHRARPDATLLLFGNFARNLGQLPGAAGFSVLAAEHPYNIGFINDPAVQAFFRPLDLLRA